MTTLQSKGLELKHIRGQGYDGASNMSSARGVQGRIKEKSPLAVYMHCNSHVLNLVIAKTCSLVDVRLVLDKLKSVCLFFHASPKREGLLEAIVSENEQAGSERRRALIDLCRTRWAARHEAYRHFYQSYCYVIQAFEVISLGLHLDEYESVANMFADWDYKSKNDSGSLLSGIASFQFIITFVTVYLYLAHLYGITKKLQSTSLDILKAHTLVKLFSTILI